VIHKRLISNSRVLLFTGKLVIFQLSSRHQVQVGWTKCVAKPYCFDMNLYLNLEHHMDHQMSHHRSMLINGSNNVTSTWSHPPKRVELDAIRKSIGRWRKSERYFAFPFFKSSSLVQVESRQERRASTWVHFQIAHDISFLTFSCRLADRSNASPDFLFWTWMSDETLSLEENCYTISEVELVKLDLEVRGRSGWDDHCPAQASQRQC